jgi:hypothetical protein
MVVVSVDHRHLKFAAAAQRFRRVKSPETAANNNDSFFIHPAIVNPISAF